jgi:hypothetical protein
MLQESSTFVCCMLATAAVMAPADAQAWSKRIPGTDCVQSPAYSSGWTYGGEGNIFVTANTYVDADCPFSYDTSNTDSSITGVYVDLYLGTSAANQVCAEACSVAYNGTSGTCSAAVCNTTGTGWQNLAPTFASWTADTGNGSYTSVNVYTTGTSGYLYINGVFIAN